MPTYAYSCTECGHAFDAVQKFTDDALTACPECSGRLRKVYGSIGVSFKGSGFYRNDSRAASTGSDGAKNGAPKADSTSKGEAKTGATSDSSGSGSSGASTSSSTPSSSGSSSSSSSSSSSGSTSAAS